MLLHQLFVFHFKFMTLRVELARQVDHLFRFALSSFANELVDVIYKTVFEGRVCVFVWLEGSGLGHFAVPHKCSVDSHTRWG